MASKRRTRTRKVVYVAVVADNIGPSMRINESWACFTGVDRNLVVAQAIDARLKWGMHYHVLVGTLTQEVTTPRQFEFVQLDLKTYGL